MRKYSSRHPSCCIATQGVPRYYLCAQAMLFDNDHVWRPVRETRCQREHADTMHTDVSAEAPREVKLANTCWSSENLILLLTRRHWFRRLWIGERAEAESWPVAHRAAGCGAVLSRGLRQRSQAGHGQRSDDKQSRDEQIGWVDHRRSVRQEECSSWVHQLLWNEPAAMYCKARMRQHAGPSLVLENMLVPRAHEGSPHSQMACSTSLKLLLHRRSPVGSYCLFMHCGCGSGRSEESSLDGEWTTKCRRVDVQARRFRR